MMAAIMACAAMLVFGAHGAPPSCMDEFHRCSSLCRGAGVPHERTCVVGCAKASALCQRPAAAPVAPVAAAAPSTFAFTDANGDRFIPFGFYQYTVTKADDVGLPEQEAVHGMTLTSPYGSSASPDISWFAAMDSFLDNAAAAGFRVNFQLIGFEKLGNDAATLANLTKQIDHFKAHPA